MTRFEWDPAKDLGNRAKHGVSFFESQAALGDPRRVIAADVTHSTGSEKRYLCIGKSGSGVLTERFTYRPGVLRIFGAGYWTRGLRIYEKANQVFK